MARVRVDAALVSRGLFPSRERARAAILAGEVRVDGHVVDKAGAQIADTAEIEVASTQRYVSRGGLKLEGALSAFGMSVAGIRAVDVGASTGGFTDCLLQHGAEHVTAVDVGYGQLAWSLRNDERVAVFERTNIRYADPETLGAPFDLAVVDVSFIGLRVVLPHVLALLGEHGTFLGLVKPQFEVGKGRVGKRGVVRDPALHEEVLRAVTSELRAADMKVRGLHWSPVTGPEGNIEFWVWADRDGPDVETKVRDLVARAHEELGA